MCVCVFVFFFCVCVCAYGAYKVRWVSQVCRQALGVFGFRVLCFGGGGLTLNP